ncbi:MAG: nucleotide exchange factor GrpE [Ruminococcus sp.]|nr:nucleotide exchange factor GrpE [Ruminococcus sp.]
MGLEKEKEQDEVLEEADKENAAESDETEKSEEKKTETDEGEKKKGSEKAAKKDKLTKENEKLSAELAEQKEKYLRLMAEYDNYRKRTAKEMLETRNTAVGDTILSVISVYDNFERAVETQSSDAKYKEGVEMIFKQFSAALDKMNVKIIDPTGEPFDPAKANAVSQIEDENLGENVVAQVFEKGVMIGDKVIRYPVVVVANP